MFDFLNINRQLSPRKYLLRAISLIATLYIFTIASYDYKGEEITYDYWFWLFPIRQLALLNNITALHASLGFVLFLIIIALLALISYQRANWSGGMHIVALFTMIPTVQVFVVLFMIFIPRLKQKKDAHDYEIMDERTQTALIMLGIFVGMAIIVIAVAISALTLGAYGWGLFVMTPFLSGLCTAYLANLGKKLAFNRTIGIVIFSGAIGCIALLMLALEGLMCIILVVPLAVIVSVIGGYIGRAIAIAQNRPQNPLYSLAILPFVFFIEAAVPPELPIYAEEYIEIQATPDQIWEIISNDRNLGNPTPLVKLSGLAYPVKSEFQGREIGAKRIGTFSTGEAQERVTQWKPNKILAFKVLHNPPAMEEISPYRDVHAPHLNGYFDTDETVFEILETAKGTSRLKVSSNHILRIDPVFYVLPIARWVIDKNLKRILSEVKVEAELK